jgi:hypothetical protein
MRIGKNHCEARDREPEDECHYNLGRLLRLGARRRPYQAASDFRLSLRRALYPPYATAGVGMSGNSESWWILSSAHCSSNAVWKVGTSSPLYSIFVAAR